MLNYAKKNTFVTDRKVSDRYYHNYYENLRKYLEIQGYPKSDIKVLTLFSFAFLGNFEPSRKQRLYEN